MENNEQFKLFESELITPAWKGFVSCSTDSGNDESTVL